MIELVWPYLLLLAPLPLLIRLLLPARRAQQAALMVPDVGHFRPDGGHAEGGGRRSDQELTCDVKEAPTSCTAT